MKKLIKDLFFEVYFFLMFKRSTILDFFYRIKYAYQRAKRGYSDSDIYNLNTPIAIIASKSIKHWLYHGVSSYPSGLTHDEWYSILEKIELAFDLYLFQENITGNNPYFKLLTAEEEAKMEEGFLLFGKWFTHLWD
jgi:hypothetical protein